MGESKDKLELTKWKPSVVTISSFSDVGDLQKLASFVMQLHMQVAQNLKLKVRQELKNLRAQLLSGAKKVSQHTSGNVCTLQYCLVPFTDFQRIITTESLPSTISCGQPEIRTTQGRQF